MQSNSISPIKNIVFIFAGEVHSDPGPVGLVKHYIEKFDLAGIPQIFCSELNHDWSLEDKQAFESKLAKENSTYVDTYSSLTKKVASLTFPYFTKDAYEMIKKVHSRALMINGLNQDKCHADATHAANLILQYINTLENLEINRSLKDLNIPYQGLERDYSQHHRFIDLLNSNSERTNEVLVAHEITRIKGMVEKLFQNALPQLKENCGIVWINCGVNHIHNLAVETLKYAHGSSVTNRSFTILPIAAFSEYGNEYKEIFLKGNLLSKIFLNNPEYRPLYEKIPFHIVDDILEIKKHNYKSRKFDILMDFAEKSFQKENLFFIPEWNETKKKLVEENHGVLHKTINNDAVISIASEKLLQPLRNSLDIDRKKITFFKESIKNVDVLKENHLITVETLPDSSQFLVTFPKSENDLIATVIK